MNVVQSPSPHVNGLAKPLINSLPESCGDSDVILLSDEEEEIVSKKPRQNGVENNSKSDTQALVIKLENELRNEESVLNLLQQIRANQRGVHKATKVPQPQITTSSKSGFVETIDISSDQESSAPTSHKDKQVVTVKVTKQVALSAIEQQFSTKRAALRKQLEKSLEKVSIPASNASSSEIAFVPSVYSGDFLPLIGLEEVCRSIRDFDPTMSKSEPRKVFNPFTCARCETDFTPVWKRDKPGSAGVACESCLAGSFRASVQKEYATAIKMALKEHAASEKELDQEYQALISDEDKLQAFMRDHEKKLNQQLATNANRSSSGGAVNGRSNGSTTNTANSTLASSANGNTAQTTAAALQQQQLNLAQVQLLAQLQQQQQKAVAANNNQTNAILNAMAASGATNLSQQQQRLTSLLTQMQSQQQTPQEALQMAQIQQVLANSLQPQQNTSNSAQQQMLSSMLLQYQLLQRQQQQQSSVQQQLAMAQQQQQQQQMLMLHAAQQQQYLQLLQNFQQQQQQQQQQGKK